MNTQENISACLTRLAHDDNFRIEVERQGMSVLKDYSISNAQSSDQGISLPSKDAIVNLLATYNEVVAAGEDEDKNNAEEFGALFLFKIFNNRARIH